MQYTGQFTEQARAVILRAEEEAQYFKHMYVGPEHVLLGLIDNDENSGVQILNKLGIDRDSVRHGVEVFIGRESLRGRGSRSAPTERPEVGFTPRVMKVIHLAADEAQRLNHHLIGSEHLLLGLISEGEGIAAQVLRDLGVTLEAVRTELGRDHEDGQEAK